MEYKRETCVAILEEKNEGWSIPWHSGKAHYFIGCSSLCKKYNYSYKPVFTFGMYKDELCKKCLAILESEV